MIRSRSPGPEELSQSSTEDKDCTTSTIGKTSSTHHHLTSRRAKIIRSASRDPEELSASSTDDEELTQDKSISARQCSTKHTTSRRAKTRSMRHEVVELLSASSADDEELTQDKSISARQCPTKHTTSRRAKTRSMRHEVVELLSASSADDEEESPAASGSPGGSASGPSQLECPICLQTCSHPTRLPCCHVYCFLCLKGIFQQDRRCAMCRQPIPPDYMKRPDLLEVPATINETKQTDDKYEWFYEGKNGWWRFEERLSQDLEEAHLQGVESLETLICGSLYNIDLKGLVQYNKDCPARKRRIKRELATNVVVKGVAGIR